MDAAFGPITPYIVTRSCQFRRRAGSAGRAPNCTLALAVILLVCLIVVVCRRAGKAARARRGALASALAARWWTLSTLRGCGYCDQQLRILGGKRAVQRDGLPLVICAGDVSDPPPCGEAAAFPYWRNLRTAEVRAGVQGISQLRAMAGLGTAN